MAPNNSGAGGYWMPAYAGMTSIVAATGPPCSTHLEDELAPEMAPLAQAMGIGGLRETIELDLGRADCARLVELGNALHVPPGASDRRPQRCDIAARGLGCLCARGNEGRAPARLEHREGFLRHLASDGVEDGVAALRDLGKI